MQENVCACTCTRVCVNISRIPTVMCRSQWPRGLRRRSAAARLLRLWVRIPQGAWMFVCSECFVLSGRRLCDGLITRPEESYRLWCVVVCDLETSRMRRPWPTGGGAVMPKTNKQKPTVMFRKSCIPKSTVLLTALVHCGSSNPPA